MTQTKQTNRKPLTKTSLFGKISYLNRKISKYRKNIEIIKDKNIELQTKLSKIPNFIKFIFGIKNN
tara:strand:+ start:46 stop:243 length:198 start_codon:yes stop_codon:yes gene_type:complete